MSSSSVPDDGTAADMREVEVQAKEGKAPENPETARSMPPDEHDEPLRRWWTLAMQREACTRMCRMLEIQGAEIRMGREKCSCMMAVGGL